MLFARAVISGQTQVIQKFMSSIGINDGNGPRKGTPILSAARYGQTAIVDLLISAGANVNFMDEDGNTALMLACAYDQPDTVYTLLQNRSKQRLTNKVGWTALMFAAERV